MDYTYYILAVLVIGLACFGVIRLVTRDRGSAVLLDYEKSRRRADKRRWHARPDDLQVTATSGRSARASSRQPVRPGLNASLRSWTDRLVREKQLVDSAAAGIRNSNSIRALLEDRYGRVGRDAMTEIEYHRVRRPLLRDPSEPHDQMDNLGTAGAEIVRRRLKRIQSMETGKAARASANVRARAGGGPASRVQLKDVRQPWGW